MSEQKSADLRRYKILLFVLSLTVAFAFQGSRALYETTEGRYAEVALEMLKSGNFLEPTLNGRPHWAKPPLAYWGMAAGMALLGTNEWGVRLFEAVAFVATCLLVAGIGSALWDRTVGVLAGIAYATAPYPVVAANIASTDTFLAFFEIAVVYFYVRAAFKNQGRRSSFWIACMWLALGLAFFTKGPTCFLVFAALVVWHLWSKPPVRLIGPSGIVLFLLAGLSWYVFVIAEHSDLLGYFLGHELAARFYSSSFHNRRWYKPFVIYLPVLTAGLLPWFAILCYTRFRKEKLPPYDTAEPPAGNRRRLLVLWIAIPLFVFSIVRSRLPLYVLPLAAPILLLCAEATARLWREKALRRACTLAVATGVLLVGAKGTAALLPTKKDMRRLYHKCLEAGGKNAVLASLNRAKLFGLQFYNGGKLLRISSPRKEDWADMSLNEALKRFKEERRRTWVLVGGRDTMKSAVKLLQDKGFGVRTTSLGFWTICVLRPESPPLGRAGAAAGAPAGR